MYCVCEYVCVCVSMYVCVSVQNPTCTSVVSEEVALEEYLSTMKRWATVLYPTLLAGCEQRNSVPPPPPPPPSFPLPLPSPSHSFSFPSSTLSLQRHTTTTEVTLQWPSQPSTACSSLEMTSLVWTKQLLWPGSSTYRRMMEGGQIVLVVVGGGVLNFEQWRDSV